MKTVLVMDNILIEYEVAMEAVVVHTKGNTYMTGSHLPPLVPESVAPSKYIGEGFQQCII